MQYSRKELREITGLPDKTLRWLLEKLYIQPAGHRKTLFGRKILLYDNSALDRLHEYVFKRNIKLQEYEKGKRCRGGCNRFMAPEFLNSAQICDHCRRKKWLLNEATHKDPLTNNVDFDVLQDLSSILAELSAK